ncbi:hypothetical protein [Virgibacillus proomii]|uniref:hypothetical protein n=1 Tax=Virgibacillus proomii TaxID=84407 RepID=UPI001C112BEF|nr:hypothetical protein [Virgibacillus proomii]MBU5265728.1 hypothetical protein [Virgibacillus proomii]
MTTNNYRDFKAEQQAYKELNPKTRKQVVEMTQNFIMQDGVAIDLETGEVITDKLYIEPKINGEVFKGKQTVDNLAKHQTVHGGFVFAFFEAYRSMHERFPFLSKSDLARLMFVGTYISWETNHLVYDNGRPINKKNLGELLGMSRNAYATFYRSLTKNGILSEAETGLIVDSSLFFRGDLSNAPEQTKNLQYTRMFRKTIRDLYNMFNGRSIKKLSVIYEILPYVNFNYNIICHNPSEVQQDKITPMTIKELAQKLGYADYRKLMRALRDIKIDDISVFGFFSVERDSRKKKVVVNPAVVYAGNGKHLEAIKILFR